VSTSSFAHRGTWLAVVVLGATLVAMVIGAVFYVTGASAVVVLGAVGAAFPAAAGLGMRMFDFLTT
jgi:hypothetical protein